VHTRLVDTARGASVALPEGAATTRPLGVGPSAPAGLETRPGWLAIEGPGILPEAIGPLDPSTAAEAIR
jgi:hypothetical protein